MIRFSSGERVSTPVANVFITKYMSESPPEWIKLYLYGVYLAYSGETMDVVLLEETLKISSELIQTGMEYWAGKGLVKIHTNARGTTYEFLPSEMESTYADDAPEKSPTLYEYQAYNNMLNTLLRRTLSASDLQKIYDFTDVYGLPQETVITLIEYCVNNRGNSVSLAYLDKTAQGWAEEGIVTREEAQQKIDEHKAISGGARIVMKQMGLLGKLPGQTERDYYNKWTEKWGFTQESILYAMKGQEFAKDNPFRYLDAILRSLYEQGITSSRKISEFNAARTRRIANLKEVLTALKYNKLSSMLPRCEEFYERWEQDGFTHETILFACEHIAAGGSRSLKIVDTLLNEWRDNGIETEADIRKYMRQQNTTEKKVKQIYDCAGIKRQIGESDRAWYLACTKESKMSHDALMYAAEISSLANEPLPFLRKVLMDWSKNGVHTLEDARQQNMNRYNGDMKNKKAFAQHSYSSNDLEQQKLDELQMMETLNDQ